MKSSHPVDSTGITEGTGIPDTDLDRLIAATDCGRPNQFEALLSSAALQSRQAAEDIDDALGAMPDDTSISVGLDLTNAQAHLRTAERLLAHAADAQEVTR